MNQCQRKHTTLGRAALKRTQKCQDCRNPHFRLGRQRKRTVSVWSKANLIKRVDCTLALRQTDMRERSRMPKHCLTFYSYCYYTKKLYKCVNTDLNTRHTVPPAVGVFSEGEARNKEGEEGEQNWKHKKRLRR